MKKNKKNVPSPEILHSDEPNPFFSDNLISILKIIIPILLSVQLWLHIFSNTKDLAFQSEYLDQGIHKRTIFIVISILLIIYSFLIFLE